MNDRVFTVAAYIRLSSEDKDLDDRKIESESVSNQRDYIKEYINNDSDLNGAKYMEFVDDGYSGLDFHRPNFNEMIKRAMNGDIDCIIVKDFSRFARNHIETGNFLEQVFPFINVRFISINDHYDSKFADNTPGIDIGFRNIL
ncbi:MAG: recombinase family protein [Firmicutes bacterium]|nr:recombinase family protein [Bacillota bacterium]